VLVAIRQALELHHQFSRVVLHFDGVGTDFGVLRDFSGFGPKSAGSRGFEESDVHVQSYVGLRGPGLYWIIPLGIEHARTIDIRTRTVSAEQQQTITRDSVTIRVNAVLWYHITEADRSVIAVKDAAAAVYQLALTSLRNIIGQHDLDEVLQERNKINGLLRGSIAEVTTAWGIVVERFEMKDVELPEAMQQVMAMQAEAIREKRARIIKAEAELEASKKLGDAAEQMANNPVAVELRRMQMVTEVGAENNSTTVLMVPSDFVTLAKSFNQYLSEHTSQKTARSRSDSTERAPLAHDKGGTPEQE
jgi:regulator of protease activity HflC (stomatin/prohibitin superfamily)